MKMENVDEQKIKKKEEVKQDNNQKDIIKNNFWPIEDLPSRFKIYPEGTKFFGRPLKVLEIKMLSTLNENNVNHVINSIIKKSINVVGISHDDILVSDKLYLVFWLRANTYKDSGYKVGFECSECEQESTYTFNLSDLEIKYLEEYNKEPIKLKDGDEIGLKFQSLKEEQEANSFIKKNKGKPLMEIDEELVNYATLISTINGEKKSLKDNYEYLINLSPEDYVIIVGELENRDIGIVPIINVKCDKCGGIAPAGVSFRGDFFLPKYIT